MDKKKIVIKVQNESVMVYDDIEKGRIDLFANNEEGHKKIIALVREMLED